MDFHGFTREEIVQMADEVRNRQGDYLASLEVLEELAISTLN